MVKGDGGVTWAKPEGRKPPAMRAPGMGVIGAFRLQKAAQKSAAAAQKSRAKSRTQTKVVAKSSLTKNLLERALNSSFLFRSLKAHVISQIVNSMFEVKVPNGRTIIHEGEDGDNFYVVTSGRFDVVKDVQGQSVKLIELGPGMVFGELALLYNCARAATIYATVDSTVWALDRESFNMTVVYHSEETRVAQILRSSQFFSPITEHELTHLIHHISRKVFKAAPPEELGEVVLKKGKTCESLHIVMEGEVTVRHVINKTPVNRTLGPGQVFGVVEAMKGQPADANIYATGKTSSGTTVLTIPKSYLEDLKHKLSKQISSAAIVQYLARSPITKALNQEGLESLCPLFVKEKLPPGFHPFPNGMTKEICILHEGSVTYKGKVLSTPGKIFGEDVLNGQYRVPCIATGDEGASMFVLKEEKLEEVIYQIEKSKMLATLKTVQLFISLSQSELEELADAMQAYNFKRDEVLIKQGDAGDKFYILCFGELVVLKKTDEDGPELEMMRLKEGCFGERALLENKPRAATIKAVTNGRVYTIGKEAFEEHLGSLSELMALHTQEVERQQMNEKIQFHDLQPMRTIGVGSFGRVRLVYHSLTDEIYGMKSLAKRLIVKYKQENHMRNERMLMAKVSHPFCSRLIKSFNQGSHVHLVTEYSAGGELFHLLDRQDGRFFRESQAKFYAACVILVLEHLHTKGIIYRDLKPENLMLDTEGYIKVIDFGFSKEVDGYTYTMCGTPDYIAPEIITMQGHNRAVDYWSLGVLIYEMILGVPPFGTTNESEQQVYQNILDNNYDLPEEISAEAADLISRLLVNDPSRRLGMQRKGVRDLKEHAWLRDIDFIRLERKKLEPPYKPEIDDNFDSFGFDRYDDAEDTSSAPFTSGTWDDCF